MKQTRESCILCGCKHVAQARVLMLEYKRSPVEYEEHYDFALGHLAEAEDELVKYHVELAALVRDHRKKLEEDTGYAFPYGKVILQIRHQGEEETQKRIDAIEAEFQGMTDEELRSWWFEIQK